MMAYTRAMSDILDIANVLDEIDHNLESDKDMKPPKSNQEPKYPKDVTTPSGEIVRLSPRALHNSAMLGKMSQREIIARLNSNIDEKS